MIPSFSEMAMALNDLSDVLVYQSAQPYQWGVLAEGTFKFIVDERKPSDEFLIYYITRCSPENLLIRA